MRLGFHYHTPAIQSGEQIQMPGYLGLFVDSLASRCEQLVCFQHTPLGDETSLMDYPLKSSNVRLVDIGPHRPVPYRTFEAYTRRALYRKWQSDLDVMLVRAPTPLLPIVASAWGEPLALLLVSDPVVGIENLPQPSWRKTLIRLHANWYQAQQRRIAQDSLVFVNSRLLYEQFCRDIPNLVETRTTTLSEQDFFVRGDTCGKAPYRLLYAGRMARIKGLFEIVQALSLLVKDGWDVVLDLVGMLDKGDPVLDELSDVAGSLGVGNRLHYHGYKTAGPELLAYYRRADLYIIASQASSEGFPRTIWEAMASSLPVVATCVGSIPAFIQEAALLVPPKQPKALVQAIQELLTQPGLRQQLIHRGMELARDNTLEARAAELITHMQGWLATHHRNNNPTQKTH